MTPYFVGEQWTDATSLAWIGGLVDRAGHLSSRPQAGQLSLMVSARDDRVLHEVRDLFGAGEVAQHHKIEGLWVWRVSEPEAVRTVLRRLAPFLVVLAKAAHRALGDVDRALTERSKRRDVDRQVLAMREEGWATADIARQLGVSPQRVTRVVARYRQSNQITIRPIRRRSPVP